MPFLLPNQQRQSTEGKAEIVEKQVAKIMAATGRTAAATQTTAFQCCAAVI